MIKSFACKDTEKLSMRISTRKFRAIERQAMRKLVMIDAAQLLADLRVPPANHLEALRHDRQGQHSIRIDKQWRVCFRWVDGEGAYDVEIVDYH